VAGKADMRNRKITLLPVGDEILVNEECDFFVLIDSVWTFYGEGRISTLFTKTNKGWKIIQEHGSMPDARTSEGEQVNTDKIKAENIRLKDAVKRRTVELESKNRELEIETALEKVRTVAMSMKEPGDMLSVCKTISVQLAIIGH
jgi:phosphoglycerate-specific signal transduction histidine kinase